MRNLFYIVLLFLLLSADAFGQFYVMPYDERTDDYVLGFVDSPYIHLSFKPFVFDKSYFKPDPTDLQCLTRNKTVKRIFASSMFQVNTRDFTMNLNLLGWLNYGKWNDDTINYSRNTRGFEIFGTLGKDLFYYTKFLENQAYFVPYINQGIEQSLVVPGEGWWKPFGTNGRDYTYATGYLVYEPKNWIYFRLGHDKNFIGSGYRSLLLSDNSFSYPQFSVTMTRGHFKFVSVWSELYRFKVRYYYYHYSKHATFNLLSYAGKHYEVSLFQAVMWKTSDYSTYVNRFPALFFVPVLATPVYGLDGENNVLLGADWNVHYKTFVAYGQLLVDKWSFSNVADRRFGWQAGLRTYDLFLNKIKWLKLKALAEYNYVAPYTYQSVFWNQNYAHYNQALAHPLGAGFNEKVLLLDLRLLNLSVKYKYTLANVIACEPDCDYNAGTDIFDTGPVLEAAEAQEFTDRIIHNSVIFEFYMHSSSGLRFYIGFDRRNAGDNNLYSGTYTFFGIKTGIGNLYYDF